jgi:hypothetical protein
MVIVPPLYVVGELAAAAVAESRPIENVQVPGVVGRNATKPTVYAVPVSVVAPNAGFKTFVPDAR